MKKTAKIAENQKGDKVIMIEFPYDVDLLEKVRSLTGRIYHKEERCWSAPLFPATLKELKSWDFEFDEDLSLYWKKHTHRQKRTIPDIPGLKGKMFPYQGEGVWFIDENDGRALIADEMGLGKTLQALAWLQLHPEHRVAIIVVPASLKLNWQREADHWMSNPKTEVLSGTKTFRPKGKIIIINYDILPAWLETLKKLKPKVVIFDECHYFKSNKAQRTKAVKKLAKGVPHVICLSGTPIVNRPIEAFNAINLINPEVFPNYRTFIWRYCGAKFNGFGVDVNGASNTDELHEKLTGTIMLRRLKADVLPDLPDKIRSFIPLQLTNRKEYEAAEADFIAFLRKEKGDAAARKASAAQALAEIEGLKQLSVHGKMPEVISWVTEFLESGNKLVLFATHRFVIDELMEAFPDITVKIDGSVSQSDRQQAVDRFQTDPKIQLFLGNIKAAGVGITLTAASNVAIVELPWTPGDLAQAIDRCHRIGQKDCVNIHFLLALDTIEEKIAKLLDNKMKIVNSVLDGIETEQDSLLAELIKEYK